MAIIEKEIGNYLIQYNEVRYSPVKIYQNRTNLIAEIYDDTDAEFIAQCFSNKESKEFQIESAKRIDVDRDNTPIIQR